MIARELAPSETAVKRLTVRQAEMNDIDALMPLVHEHWPSLPWGHKPLNESLIRALFAWTIKGENARAWVIDDGERPQGFMALSVFPHLYTGEPQASNPWWYVTDAARGTRASYELLRTAERWANEQGAVVALSVHDEKVAKMLERMRYHRVEITLRKGV